MSAPLGSADFFALEAGECLDHLDVLISQPDGGDPSQMLRYSRALRGSADSRPLTILVATSGDTGGAVAAAFHGRRGTLVGTSARRGSVGRWRPARRDAWPA